MKDIRKYIRQTIKENFPLEENTIIPPTIPNSMNFWHGGNLDDYDDIIAQKNGRYEFGTGLYLTTSYEVASKYHKGNRKLYLVTVALGKEIHDATLDLEKAKQFINTYVLGSMRKLTWERLQRFNSNLKVPMEGNTIKAYVFNNIIINNKAIKSSNTKFLRAFYVENGIDYEMVDNAFGWGEKMMVLYNMKKIVNTIVVKSTDKIEVYDLLKNK